MGRYGRLAAAAVLGALSTAGSAAAASWHVQRTPNPASSELNGVSCAGARACTAVGFAIDNTGTQSTLAERWNGADWKLQTTPKSSAQSPLSGVSCAAPNACTAVGYFFDGAGVQATLALRWNGTRWTVQSTPNPADAGSSQLTGVSCPSASVCTAVGHYTDPLGTELTLAERWNGTSWALQTTPNPTGAASTVFDGVSCPSARACTAVGVVFTALGSQKVLSERYDGSGWVIQRIPSPSDAGNELLGVSCSFPRACTAVGIDNSVSGPFMTLAERFTGVSWTGQSTPNPGLANQLLAVSCSSAHLCTAVGAATGSAGSPGLTLAERWNGANWATQTTPNPAGETFDGLAGVSCTATSACTAIGNYNTEAGASLTFAERYS